MKTLNVPDMHCNKCVERISKALTNANIAFTICLDNKTVTVSEENLDSCIEILDDLGFDAK